MLSKKNFFEYSPLGKVLYDKDKDTGILKTLKEIRDKPVQLALPNTFPRDALPIPRRSNNDDDDSNDDDDDDNDDKLLYKSLEAKKKDFKNKNITDPAVNKEFDNIVRRSGDLEGKRYIVKIDDGIGAKIFNNNSEKITFDYSEGKIKQKDIVRELNKVIKGVEYYRDNTEVYENSLNIENQIKNTKKYVEGLKKIIIGIDTNKPYIGKDFIKEPGFIDLSWMHDPQSYDELSQDIFSNYNNKKNSFELFSMKRFLDNINDIYILKIKKMH